MLYLDEVAFDAPYAENIEDCKIKILTGPVANDTIRGVVSRSGIYKVVIELRLEGTLIAVCKAFVIQWHEVADEIAELQAGWGGVDDIDFKEALKEVTPSLGELSKLFTPKARLRANSLSGAVTAGPNVWQRRGPMGTDEDEGRLQNIALLDYILVSPANRGRGVGRKLVRELMDKLHSRFSTTHIVSFPSALNVNRSLSKGHGEDASDEVWRIREQNSSIKFHRELGFRRLFGTKFFCYAYEADHAARKMTKEEDEMRDRSLGLWSWP